MTHKSTLPHRSTEIGMLFEVYYDSATKTIHHITKKRHFRSSVYYPKSGTSFHFKQSKPLLLKYLSNYYSKLNMKIDNYSCQASFPHCVLCYHGLLSCGENFDGCNHLCHQECFKKWIKNGNSFCPVCN
jgi:hypothetical protein